MFIHPINHARCPHWVAGAGRTQEPVKKKETGRDQGMDDGLTLTCSEEPRLDRVIEIIE